MSNAFVTGSFAYGTPNESSDIDLAVLMVMDDAMKVHEEQGLRKINVIMFDNAEEFEAWRTATEKLKAAAPVTRKTAIEVIDEELEKIGIMRVVCEDGVRRYFRRTEVGESVVAGELACHN